MLMLLRWVRMVAQASHPSYRLFGHFDLIPFLVIREDLGHIT
jgi:hypothetical protein